MDRGQPRDACRSSCICRMTGASLKDWRIRRGLSQQALADAIGWSRYTIMRHEARPTEPVPTFVALSLAAIDYGLPPMR